MLQPLQLFRIMNEMLFVVVGALLLWVALSGRFPFDPRSPSWLILSGVLIVWGIFTWQRARRVVSSRSRLAMRIGGSSITLVGAIMLSLAWVSFGLATVLLCAAGGIFVLRGLASVAILARPT